jgi:hypothetical protein
MTEDRKGRTGGRDAKIYFRLSVVAFFVAGKFGHS